jgi:hypothetical protein
MGNTEEEIKKTGLLEMPTAKLISKYRENRHRQSNLIIFLPEFELEKKFASLLLPT